MYFKLLHSPYATRLLNTVLQYESSPHTSKVDKALNEAMRTISGCLRSTPTDVLPILSGIEPPDLRRKRMLLKISRKARDTHESMLHPLLNANLDRRKRLKSRNPMSRRMSGILEGSDDKDPAQWLNEKWQDMWQSTNFKLKDFVPSPNNCPTGADLPRQQWVK